MSVKKKHTKTFESVTRRISVVSYEIEQLKEEMQELVNHANDFQHNAEVTIRSIKNDYGISVTNWVL